MWSRTPQTSTSLVVACPLSIRGPWEAFRRQQGGYRRRVELQKRLKKIKGLRNIQVLNRKNRTIYWMMSGKRAVLNKHVITSYSSRQKKNPLLMQIFRSSELFDWSVKSRIIFRQRIWMFFYRFFVIYKQEESLLIIAMTLQEKILIESDSIKNSLIVFADLRTLKRLLVQLSVFPLSAPLRLWYSSLIKQERRGNVGVWINFPSVLSQVTNNNSNPSFCFRRPWQLHLLLQWQWYNSISS